MTSHELARKLLEGPDLLITVPGYEGGVDEITRIAEPSKLMLNRNEEWYYGKHEYQREWDEEITNPIIMAIHISA